MIRIVKQDEWEEIDSYKQVSKDTPGNYEVVCLEGTNVLTQRVAIDKQQKYKREITQVEYTGIPQ